jgi:hypothetical protein
VLILKTLGGYRQKWPASAPGDEHPAKTAIWHWDGRKCRDKSIP